MILIIDISDLFRVELNHFRIQSKCIKVPKYSKTHTKASNNIQKNKPKTINISKSKSGKRINHEKKNKNKNKTKQNKTNKQTKQNKQTLRLQHHDHDGSSAFSRFQHRVQWRHGDSELRRGGYLWFLWKLICNVAVLSELFLFV